MTSENIKSCGAKRTYSNAHLTSEYDGDCIGQEIIRQMLNLMSFESIQNFNNIMGEFNDRVERQSLLLEAEEWAKGVRSIHVHSITSMCYETEFTKKEIEVNGAVTDTEYNN